MATRLRDMAAKPQFRGIMGPVQHRAGGVHCPVLILRRPSNATARDLRCPREEFGRMGGETALRSVRTTSKPRVVPWPCSPSKRDMRRWRRCEDAAFSVSLPAIATGYNVWSGCST
ncbi:hypothetical protein GCM10028802_27380 [Terrabacter terrigena]